MSETPSSYFKIGELIFLIVSATGEVIVTFVPICR